MALKALQKPKRESVQIPATGEDKIKKFIASGGSLAVDQEVSQEGDHRLTLRIPKSLMNKIDVKRKKRVGKISRNLWILETIEKATSSSD